jgi:hypothetical protein
MISEPELQAGCPHVPMAADSQIPRAGAASHAVPVLLKVHAVPIENGGHVFLVTRAGLTDHGLPEYPTPTE